MSRVDPRMDPMELQVLRVKVALGLVALVLILGLLGAALLALARVGKRKLPRWARGTAWTCLALLSAGGLCFLYGLWVEADWLEVTHVQVRTPRLPRGARLRIVQLSDLHVDGMSSALRQLPEKINPLQPDLLLFTGDAINSREAVSVFSSVLSGIHTRLGRYAVLGNHDLSLWPGLQVLSPGVVTELKGKAVTIMPGVTLCGAPYGKPEQLISCLYRNPAGFRIAAYHTPDLVKGVSEMGADLYLAGHTHGGQVRLPFYGALITMSWLDKKYEMGRYLVRNTVLYVNRGIGFTAEAPRVRFLCRPEVTVIDVVGTGGSG